MKKRYIITTLLLIFSLLFLLCSCDEKNDIENIPSDITESNDNNNNDNNNTNNTTDNVETKYYDVTYNNVTSLTKDTYKEGDIIKEPETPTKTGYFFDGWYEDANYENSFEFGKEIKSNVTLYAKWTAGVYITYDVDGEKTKELVRKNKEITPIENPVKEGYFFEGWYTDKLLTKLFDFKPISRSLTLYAKWEKGVYLTYNIDGEETKELVRINKKIEKPKDPEKYEYFFANWYTDETFENIFDFSPISVDTTIYAKFNKGYYLTYNVDGEETTELVESNTNITAIENPTKENYIFAGWYTDEALTNKYNFKNITENTIIYAKWGTPIPSSRPADLLKAKDISTLEGYDIISNLTTEQKKDISAGGYVANDLGDFSKYIGTDYYRQVSTPLEFLQALALTKNYYTTAYDYHNNDIYYMMADGYNENNYYQKVHVIEITQDLNLGYNLLSQACKDTGVVSSFMKNVSDKIYISEMVTTNGISQISIQNTSDLLIYSKNGSKITHASFKIGSSNNVVIRNLEFDEIWQWEDSSSYDVAKMGDYDAFGWAYFKISFSGYVWIDHCTFGKSYDGQIDYSNPVYDVPETCFRAPFKANGNNGLHISWCNFNAGSDDLNGYLYKMMEAIENDYLAGKNNCLYYKKLRDSGISFETILYGLAIPQKKGFLLGDNGTEDQKYNPEINVSFAYCYFKNIEDRLPKLRGGDCYMYNSVIDNSQYYSYRNILKAANAKTLIENVKNSSNKAANWKCGLVSQGIVPSQNASVMAENCIFKGIESLIKNNDSGTGCYKMKNCSYQRAATDTKYTINTESDIQSSWISGTLSTSDFNWNTKEAPFSVKTVQLSNLESILNNTKYGSGTNTGFGQTLTVCKY